jgi:hypothetical protein
VVWDVARGAPVLVDPARPVAGAWCSVSEDGRHLLLPGDGDALTWLSLPGLERRALACGAPVLRAVVGPGDAPDVHVLLRPEGAPGDVLVRLAADGTPRRRRELGARADDRGPLALAPGGRHLALVTAAGDIALADAATLEPLLELPAAAPRRVDDLRFVAGGRVLLIHAAATGTEEFELAWDDTLRRVLPVAARAVHAVSADGTRAALDVGGAVQLWDRPAVGGDAFVRGAVGPTLAESGDAADGRASAEVAELIDATVGRAGPPLPVPPGAGAVRALAFDAAGRRLAATDGAQVWSWDLDTAESIPLIHLRDGDDPVHDVGFDAAGRLLFVAAPPGEAASVIRVTEPRDPGETWVLPLPPDTAGAKLTLDGPRERLLAVSLRDARSPSTLARGPLRVHDLPGGALRWSVPLDAAACMTTSSVAPDGSLVASAAGGSRLALRDGRDGALLMEWQAHAAPLDELHFLGGPDRLLTRSTAGELILWDVATLHRRLSALELGF